MTLCTTSTSDTNATTTSKKATATVATITNNQNLTAHVDYWPTVNNVSEIWIRTPQHVAGRNQESNHWPLVF